jgi:hypothetical protein
MNNASKAKGPLPALLALALATALTLPMTSVGASNGVELRVETTLPTAQTNGPALAFDGKPGTWFRSSRGADENDQFTVYFSEALKLRQIQVLTGDDKGTNQLGAGILEISTDGKEFKEVAKFEAGVAKAKLKKQPVMALRIRPTKKDQPAPEQSGRGQYRRNRSSLVIREIALNPAPVVQKVTQSMCIMVDTSEVPELDAWGKHAKELCEQWYPKIVDLLPSEGFEPLLSTRLLFKKDKGGVADTSRGTDISIAAKYVIGHTNDFGMVIHELTHVVQAYPGPKDGFTKPGWLVEGIADNIRLFHFEPDVRRPRINPDKANYTDAYKTTAGFLDWVEKNYDKELVKKLSAALRQGEYQDSLWQKCTGKTVDELWKEFADSLRKTA